MDIPKTAKPGGYVIQADASYGGFAASAIDTFAVRAGAPLGEFTFPDPLAILLVILLVAPTVISVVLAVVVFRLIRKKK